MFLSRCKVCISGTLWRAEMRQSGRCLCCRSDFCFPLQNIWVCLLSLTIHSSQQKKTIETWSLLLWFVKHKKSVISFIVQQNSLSWELNVSLVGIVFHCWEGKKMAEWSRMRFQMQRLFCCMVRKWSNRCQLLIQSPPDYVNLLLLNSTEFTNCPFY